MKYLNTILFLILINSLAVAQNFEVFALGKAMTKNRGLVVSEQFMKIDAEEGNTEVLAELGSLHNLSKGTTAFNHLTNELLIWGKKETNSAYDMYVVDASTGKLSQKPISFNQPPVDVHFDMRQHVFYGIRHSESTKGLEIIQIDGNSTISHVMDLPELKSVSLGVTAFDSNNSFYIFAGTDKSYNERLYVIDIVNRQILSSSLIKGFYFYELQYDVQDSKLYALCRKRSNTQQFFFVEIVPLEARPVIIAPMTDINTVSLGGSTFEQKEGLYFFSGKDKENKPAMYVIDALTGDMFTKSYPEATITALECNNTTFLNSYFNKVSDNTTQNEEPNSRINGIDDNEEIPTNGAMMTSKRYYNLEIIPKHIIDWANIDVNIETGKGFEVAVYDLTDNLVLKEKLFKSEKKDENVVDMSGLKAGIYLVKVKTANQTYTQRVIKR
ncbi:MAG: T9SS type A sorting domain-containing protein [Saprospiraceae bacterium]